MEQETHHTRCPKCGHHWSVKGENSEYARQHCDECGHDCKPKLDERDWDH